MEQNFFIGRKKKFGFHRSGTEIECIETLKRNKTVLEMLETIKRGSPTNGLL